MSKNRIITIVFVLVCVVLVGLLIYTTGSGFMQMLQAHLGG